MTYELLDEKIQKVIYKMGWTHFKLIQDEAIQYLVRTPNDLVISAPTASGKTEACFLPIISNIIKSNYSGIKVLYISPLKALINDQFWRVEKLCEELQFPVVKWHGDANYKEKVDLLKNPDGILLITPESIEALFINKYRQLTNLFQNLKYVVVDEIHSFVGGVRGNHLFSLLNRLEKIIDKKIIKIGLSATISDVEPIKKWLNYESPDNVKVIESKEGSGLRGEIKGYTNSKNVHNDLFEVIRNGKNLIFANSKSKLEEYCVCIRELSKKEKILNRFFIHHGSLSKEIRETTEIKLKNETNISVFSTNTLELGIDIGNIDRIIFLDTPNSVSSFIQRIGRSGRKVGTNRNFKIFVEEMENNNKLAIADKLRLDTVRSIAMVELLAKDKWCEPLEMNLNYSTIIHQVLSLLASTGGTAIENIYQIVAIEAYKGMVTKEKFLKIIKSLRDKQVIYQLQNGLIALTKDGENIVHNYKFYPAFVVKDEYEIVFNDNLIGFIDIDNINIDVGDNIIISGGQWEIINIIKETRKVLVKKSKSGEALFVSEDAGGLEHKKIHEKMKDIYEEKITSFSYLNENAKLLLQEGIEEYKIMKNNSLLVFGGTKVQNTLSFIFTNFLGEGREFLENFTVGFYHPNGKNFLKDVLRNVNISQQKIHNMLIDSEKSVVKVNKFDHLLPKELLVEEYVRNNFDFCNKLIT
ncbi:MAG: DEAD/DEAH box helicase [Rickettsiales bacterium]|jgi:ATP-dependent Lhr-like helicase|nr:DEAD/DEAH box helicase [Rickettsiales bacterium]